MNTSQDQKATPTNTGANASKDGILDQTSNNDLSRTESGFGGPNVSQLPQEEFKKEEDGIKIEDVTDQTRTYSSRITAKDANKSVLNSS